MTQCLNKEVGKVLVFAVKVEAHENLKRFRLTLLIITLMDLITIAHKMFMES